MPALVAASPARELSATISPDGRFVAYSSDQNGTHEVFVVPFPEAGRAKWQVSVRGGTEPLWSHSGREIFFRDREGNMVAAAVRTAPTFSADQPVVLFPAATYRALPNHRQYAVSVDDKRILMLRPIGTSAVRPDPGGAAQHCSRIAQAAARVRRGGWAATTRSEKARKPVLI